MLYVMMAILILIVLAMIWGSTYFAKLAAKPKVYPYEVTFNYEKDNGRIDEDWYSKLENEAVSIQSPYGYMLDGILFHNKNSKKVIIFCHGITWSKYGSVKYMNMFLKRGFNVLIYDHRNHGKSGGEVTTFGYFEKYDLMACVDFVVDRFGKDAYIGIHGESMGAGTALLHSDIDDRPAFYIADCPYSDIKELFKIRIKEDFNMPWFPIVYTASLLSKLRYKFLYREVSPIEAIKNVKKPIFFIHGEQDNYIPNKMSVDMFNVKKGIKKLYIAPNADHAESFWKNKEEYEKKVEEFLNEIV